MTELNGDRASWLRCYRCWSRNLEIQLHYDAIRRVDPDTGIPAEGIDEVQEAAVQCLDCMHDQPHLTFQDDRVVPIEDRWERMVAGTPWVASCTVTVDQDRVESCAGPEAAELLAYGALGEAGVREFFAHVRFHKHDEERIVVHMLVELYARSAEEATEVLEDAAHGQLEITSLAEESRPPAHASDEAQLPERDRPWVMRTYAGHSDARRSNELYRKNLEKGQTGLSVAFDLPTQTGYDPDHVLARGEVGKVGVSIAHKGDMHQLFDGIPLDEMNTSMTINATAAWLLGLYVTVAEENGVERGELTGTTQNDIIKEYLSRGTYAFPPEPSMRLIADMVAFTVNEAPKWNPTNICSYHLQEAGATPVQEIAYALSTGIAVLDEVKARGQVAEADFPQGLRPHLLLRQRRHPPGRGDRQAARDGPAVERDRP